MPYNKGTNFVSGDVLSATELNSKNENARKYINVNIEGVDLQTGTFQDQDLQRGEFRGITDEFVFATGDSYGFRNVSKLSIGSERRYHSATIKNFDPQISVRYTSVPDLAKEFYMEDFGNVMVEVAFYTREYDSDDARGIVAGGSVGSSSLTDSKFYLAVDGVVDLDTIANAFEESSPVPTSQSSATGLNTRRGSGARKFCLISQMVGGLGQGWHTIQVVVDPRNEKGFVSHRMFNLEIFYRGGFEPVSASTIATNRTLVGRTY